MSDTTEEPMRKPMDKHNVRAGAAQGMDYQGGRYPNDHGRYLPEDALDPTERSAVGNTAARVHIHLHNIFICRESLEIAAGALQRALVIADQTDVPEKYRLYEVRSLMDIARARILDLRKGKKENKKS